LFARAFEPHRGRDWRGLITERKTPMSNDTTSKKRPTYRVFNINRKDDSKNDWTEIGAAWPHKDGKGFSLTFTAKPADGADTVLRLPTAKKGGAQ
jgi:hypothetical protein